MANGAGSQLPSKKTPSDTVHAVVRAALSALPGWGGPAGVLFESIFAKPSERRTGAVVAMLSSAVAELQKRPTVDFDALRDNGDFCEFAHDVLRAASHTHRREKLDAFRNILVNAALPPALDDTKARVFLRLVDDFDVHHLLLLQLMASPATFLAKRKLPFPAPGDRLIEMDATTQHQSPRSLASIVNNVLRDELPSDLQEIVLQDLVRRGLTSTNTLGVLCTRDKSFASGLGHEFVSFIANPPEPR